MTESRLSTAQAEAMIEALALDLEEEAFDVGELRRGIEVEMEHGPAAGSLDLTEADPLAPAKIAVVHLRLCPDYYERLDEMRRGAALDDAARALEEEAGTGTVHHRSPCRPGAWAGATGS